MPFRWPNRWPNRWPIPLGVLLSLASCANRTTSTEGGPRSTTGVGATSGSAAATGSTTALAGGPQTDDGKAGIPKAPAWRRAAREMRWQDVITEGDKLDPAAKADPHHRLARGLAALKIARHTESLAALKDLEQALPVAKASIIYWRSLATAGVASPRTAASAKISAKASASAKAVADDGAALLAKSSKVRDLLAAARSYQKLGELTKARKVLDRAVKRAERTRRRADEAEAHLLRAEVAETQKKIAISVEDWRWIVLHHAHHQRCREVIAHLDRVKGRLKLSERLSALAESTTLQNVTVTEKLYDDLLAKNPAHAGAVRMGKAHAFFKARASQRSRELFDESVAKAQGRLSEARYYAARSAIRLGDMEDATKRLQTVIAKHGKTPWAERAQFRLAEVLLLSGKYRRADASFGRYLSRYGRSAHEDRARFGRALARLSLGRKDPKLAARAAKTFKRQRDDEGERYHEALLRLLEGIARLRAGQTDSAKKLWRSLIQEQPLTWAAAMAQHRLRSAGSAPPPLIPVATVPARPALKVVLPEPALTLQKAGLDDAAETALTALEQTAGEAYPGRESEALCAMYAQLTPAARRQRVGNRAVSLRVLMTAPSARDMWAWDCVYPEPYQTIATANASKGALPPHLVHAIMRQESAFKSQVTSPVGARGLMQLMPNTALRIAAEANIKFAPDTLTRPDVNIALGSAYLGRLYTMLGQSLTMTIAAYNAGPHAAGRWLAKGADNDADIWIARIPFKETRNYVQRVHTNMLRYQWLQGGSAAVVPPPLALPVEVTIPPEAY